MKFEAVPFLKLGKHYFIPASGNSLDDDQSPVVIRFNSG